MDQVTELSYALDTFYFLVCGALVMWMAAGFTMLEAGLVRAKNTAEILTKNVGLYAIACIMYMLVGYNLMYPGDDALIAGILGKFAILGKADNDARPMSGQRRRHLLLDAVGFLLPGRVRCIPRCRSCRAQLPSA